jgi:DNA recombination protein RmuC
MLGNLLEQMLTAEQFKAQVEIKGSDAVDFAVILPGKGEENVYLPIDSKFPDTSYQRILDCTDNPAEYEAASKALVNDIKKEAKSISEKYIKPPLTTDFAIMYLPTEGLFSEAVKREGLMSEIQTRFRIMLAGPTTLSALLSSLQMGFKTLALQKRSMEIRDLLITFKHEFNKFAETLEDTQKRLGKVTDSIDSAAKRTR